MYAEIGVRENILGFGFRANVSRGPKHLDFTTALTSRQNNLLTSISKTTLMASAFCFRLPSQDTVRLVALQ